MNTIAAFLFGMFIGAEITFLLIYALTDNTHTNSDNDSDKNNN